MHISCPIGPIDKLHKQRRGQSISAGTIAARKLLLASYLICLIHHLIGNNSVGLDARASVGPRPGLISERQARWNGSTRAGDDYRQSPGEPAVGSNRLQPYHFQLKQPQAVGLTPGGAQRQPPPLIRQLTSTLPPPPLPPPTTHTPQRSAAPLQRTTLTSGLIGNGTRAQPGSVQLTPSPLINHHPQARLAHQNEREQPLLRQANYEQQVFAQTNKQVVQPQQVVYATKHQATSTRPSFSPRPEPVTTATTTTTPPAYTRNSDVTPTAGALFTCLGCDPRGWPLFKSLVSLQNPLLLGGDILVRTSKRRPIATGIGRLYKSSRSALVDPVSLWPNGVLFYELDESVAHLAGLIWRVMQQFHVRTCVRFVPRRNNEPDFIHIAARRGCSSYIGRIGGEQVLSLGDGCEFRGTIAHELLHAVGFYHHQNRSDRDDFLEILWENVAKGKEDQFRKMSAEENFLLNEFDYNSIMLYGPHTFGKTLDKITMKPKRAGVILLELIEKRGLSELDIDSVNKLYKCTDGSGLGYDLAPEQPAGAASAASSR